MARERATPKAGQPTGGPTVPGQLRAAAGLIGLEALALAAVAALLVVKTFTGDPNEVARALWGAGLALCGVAGLAMGARGLFYARPAARTPMVVLQLVALPVGYSLGFQAGRVAYGGPILLVAVATLYLLFTPPVRAVLDRPIG